ncbi:MAG: AMP-binding protein [Cellvibrionaceae bacterium]|nr:AMP-binding protein [Cellvibrionaceae bacterium]
MMGISRCALEMIANDSLSDEMLMNFQKGLGDRKLIGVVTRNSVDYVKTILKALEDGLTVVPMRSSADKERINAASVENIVNVGAECGWFTPRFAGNRSDEIALISFTSGTEGVPKGVLISFKALNDVVQRLLNVCAVDSSIREYIGVPVYHSFGFGRCRLIAQVGGKAFIPENGFSPRQIAQMLADGEINSLSAVPSMLRVLLENSELFAACGSQLRWIEIGSQPMSAEEKLRLRELFPQAGIVQHYGLTEASRTTLLRIDQSSVEELQSVGQACGATEISLSPEGKIRIKGPHLASALLIDGRLQTLPGDGEWFETNDLGRVENGYLYFEGRADNVINCAGQKIAAELLEDALREEFQIASGIAVTRVSDATYGEAILVARDETCAIGLDELKEATKKIIRKNGIHSSGVVKTYECEKLPVTDTGKVQRRLLREAYENLAAKKDSEKLPLGEATTDLQRLLFFYQKAVGENYLVSEQDNFDNLGLDSITAVRLGLEVERILGYLPNDWRKVSIQDLASKVGSVPENAAAPIGGDDNRSSLVKGATNENPAGIKFWALLKEDFQTHECDWFSQGFWAVVNHRFGNWRMGIRIKAVRAPLTLLYRMHRKLVQIFCGIKLDYTVKLGRRVKLEHFGGMILGANSIGDDVVVRQNTTIGVKDLSDLQGKPVIEQGVHIGTGAVIVGKITVGRYSVIGPNAVVDRDIPPFSYVSAPVSVIITADK